MNQAGILLIGCALVLGGGVAQEEDKEARKKALRDQIEESIKEGDWSEAASKIRKLRVLLEGDEREEADTLRLRVNGEKEWALIRKARRGKSRPGKRLDRIKRFLKKYGECESLRKRAEDLRESIRKDVFHVIDDFDDADVEGYSRDTEIVAVKDRGDDGGHALHWKTDSTGEREIHFDEFEQHDWTPYEALSMWVYSENEGTRLTIDLCTDRDSFFEAWSNIDWTGWKKLRLTLRGRGSRFRRDGKPAWENIQYLRLWKAEGQPVDIIIDDIVLEKAL